MNNLHRELVPISAVAWADLEEEARRTFKRHVAGRRVVDVPEPGGLELSAITTGHLDAVAAPAEGVIAHVRRSHPIVELRGLPAVDAGRRLRAAHRAGPVHRLPLPRRRQHPALLPGIADLPGLHERGGGGAHRATAARGLSPAPERGVTPTPRVVRNQRTGFR